MPFYYEGTGESPLNLRLMRSIDTQCVETPFYVYRTRFPGHTFVLCRLA